jgi:hypothetical protein
VSRLPVVGQDDDIWGEILNDFLTVEHNNDGTLKRAGSIASAVQSVNGENGPTITLTAGDVGAATDSAVVHKTGAETVAGVKTFSSSPIVPTPTASGEAANKTYVDSVVAGGAVDASTTTKGIVQLAGDLAGTASSPTVPGLSGKEPTIAAGTTAQYWRGDKSWQTLSKTAVGLANVDNTSDINKPISTATQTALNAKAPLASPTFTGTVTVPAPSAGTDAATKTYVDSAVAGSTAPDATTSSKGIIQLAGDLSGTAAAPTVPGLASKIDSSEKGAANGVAQLDGSGKVNPGQLQTSNITKVLPYSYLGNVVVNIGTFRLYNDTGSTWTITGVRASVGTAPAGAAIIIDVNKNGTTIFTTQANRPTIAAAANTSGNVTNVDVTTIAAGEYLTIDIDQIGSTTAGADLTVQIEVY